MLKLLVLCLIWLALSGNHTFREPMIAVFGAMSCLFVHLLSQRMERSSATRDARLLGVSVLGYLPYLFWEIAKANLAVTRIVLSPKMPIARQIVRVPADQQSAGARVLYANSITLTPGTISLAVRDRSILVHAIDDEAAQGVLSGDMNRRVAALEKGSPS